MFVSPKTIRIKKTCDLFRNNNSSFKTLDSKFFSKSFKKNHYKIMSPNILNRRKKTKVYIAKKKSANRTKPFIEKSKTLKSISLSQNLQQFLTPKLTKDSYQETDKMTIDHFEVDVNICQLKLDNKNKLKNKLKGNSNENYFINLINNMNDRKNYLSNFDKNQILKELKNQTKSNFNNKYKISYPGFNQNKREYIKKFFNSIKTSKNFNLKTKFISKLNLSLSVKNDDINHVKINNDYIKNKLYTSNSGIKKILNNNNYNSICRSFNKTKKKY